MNDTEIIDQLQANMRSYWITGVPLPPARLKQWAVWVDDMRNEQPENRRGIEALVEQYRMVGNPAYQRFWRCNHHPEAIANWSHGVGWHCEHGCDVNELRWDDHGTCRPATS